MKSNSRFLKQVLTILTTASLAAVASTAWSAKATKKADLKDWTLLVFLNGNNSLDSFGAEDINEMEKVGSSERVNVVVQWASMEQNSVKRLKVVKDEDTGTVTSPILEEMGEVDMGDWRKLVDFVAWAKTEFPAKHYFIDIWNHGAGWHKNLRKKTGELAIKDISFDDKSGNVITTEQLGQAMNESMKLLGQKVDIYGSDACLMGMAEVAGEMSDSVKVFVGSQEVEPGPGWDYEGLLNQWNALGDNATAANVAKALAKTYADSYKGGSQGTDDVTMSAFDLEKTQELNDAVKGLVSSIVTSPTSIIALFNRALGAAQKFYYSDYVDLGDFTKNFAALSSETDARLVSRLNLALKDYVIANEVTAKYQSAQGVSVWIPGTSWGFDGRKQRYSNLNFARQSSWIDVLNFTVIPGSAAR